MDLNPSCHLLTVSQGPIGKTEVILSLSSWGYLTEGVGYGGVSSNRGAGRLKGKQPEAEVTRGL